MESFGRSLRSRKSAEVGAVGFSLPLLCRKKGVQTQPVVLDPASPLSLQRCAASHRPAMQVVSVGLAEERIPSRRPLIIETSTQAAVEKRAEPDERLLRTQQHRAEQRLKEVPN